MKGDEVVEAKQCRCDHPLLAKRRKGEVDIGNILVVNMNDRFALSTLCQFVMCIPISNAQGEKIGVNVCVGSGHIQIAAKHNAW